MKQGDIIRRKVNDKPVGPYMRVQVVEDDRIYAEVLGLDEPNVLLLKKDVYIPKMSSVPVSERVLKCLKEGKTIMVQHKANSQWMAVFNNQPEIIRFYTLPKMYENVFTVEYTKRFRSFTLREDTVRVVLNTLVV